MEKEFDFIKTLENSARSLDAEMIATKAKKDTLLEIIKFMQENDLKVYQVAAEQDQKEIEE